MSGIILRVIDGADRGRIYDKLDPPITIGREEGNTIQLNDERVSRFHLKIQEDNARLVLTDLESTNGTKVNNEDIQLRILRFGDIILIGRLSFHLSVREAGLPGVPRSERRRAASGRAAKLSDPRAARFPGRVFPTYSSQGCAPDSVLRLVLE